MELVVHVGNASHARKQRGYPRRVTAAVEKNLLEDLIGPHCRFTAAIVVARDDSHGPAGRTCDKFHHK
jgi:hypothetical protein